jgi:uncharacterized membrane protein (UPF0127 family)
MTFSSPFVSVWQDGTCRIEHLKVATGFFERGIGLMFRKTIPASVGAGFLFPNCRDLHSFGMRFNLDVVWINDSGEIIDLRRNIPPNQIIRGPKSARHVFEVAAGRLPELGRELLELREEFRG